MNELKVTVTIPPKVLRTAMVKVMREQVIEELAKSLEAESYTGEAGRVAAVLCKDLATHIRRWDPDASPLPAATGRA